MTYYIEYLKASDNFRQHRKDFETEEDAIKWGKKNLSNFVIDMIKTNLDAMESKITTQDANSNTKYFIFASMEVLDLFEKINLDKGNLEVLKDECYYDLLKFNDKQDSIKKFTDALFRSRHATFAYITKEQYNQLNN